MGDDKEIINDDILGPLIQRQHGDDVDKQKIILNNAKKNWSVKVEEMIANTDQWFINEDGDIVLIYPEAQNMNNNEKKEKEINDKNDNKDKVKIINGNNVENEENEDLKQMEVSKEEFKDTNLSKDNMTNAVVKEQKKIRDGNDNDDNKQIINDKNDQKQPLITNNSTDTDNNSKTEGNVKRT